MRAAASNASALELIEAPVGGAGVDAAGDPLPAATLQLAREADAILFGSAGVPGDEAIPYLMRPGAALLRLRADLDLFAHYRPAVLYPELIDASSLKPGIVRGLDLVILRELSGDAYFGEPRGVSISATGKRVGINTMHYTEEQIERVAHAGFQCARQRKRKLCSVDKANVLDVMQLWREIVTDTGKQYPDVELSHLFVDAAAMQLLRMSCNDSAGAERIEGAVRKALALGYRTADIHSPGTQRVGTRAMGDAVLAAV